MKSLQFFDEIKWDVIKMGPTSKVDSILILFSMLRGTEHPFKAWVGGQNNALVENRSFSFVPKSSVEVLERTSKH